MLDVVLLGLLHLLVFAYWLGGDLGAFYSSRFLTLPRIPTDRRLLAAKIVGDVDMAPRTALILTVPTGLALAEAKGWTMLGWPIVAAVTAAFLIWLAIAWHLHAAHGQAPQHLRLIDLAIRWSTILGLLGLALSGHQGVVELPLFLELKLVILSACIALGLLIRRVLAPLGGALAGLSGTNSASAEASLAATLGKARPLVLCIWFLLVTAALIGLWAPL